LRDQVITAWRDKIGPRRIAVGDREISDTVEAQTGLILVNATRHAFKPGPRNYDRVWTRDGSSQALRLALCRLDRRGQELRPVVRRTHLRKRHGTAHPQSGRLR
ncbi:MAG: hypothetical protein MZV65_14850, partial [Chromatiales bacterium]|nr:hypothetical protein [Chromatiales bacterium]